MRPAVLRLLLALPLPLPLPLASLFRVTGLTSSTSISNPHTRLSPPLLLALLWEMLPPTIRSDRSISAAR
jgi:hypothetical protein